MISSVGYSLGHAILNICPSLLLRSYFFTRVTADYFVSLRPESCLACPAHPVVLTPSLYLTLPSPLYRFWVIPHPPPPPAALGTRGAGAHSGRGAPRSEGSIAGSAAHGGIRGDDNCLHDAAVPVAGAAAGVGGHAREWGCGVGGWCLERVAQGALVLG